MDVNILGTDYEIIIKKYSEEKAFERDGIDGYCDSIFHQIVLCDMTTYKGFENETPEYCAISQKRTLRHEIVHAFFQQSGLQYSAGEVKGAWCQNEEMIDWIALQGMATTASSALAPMRAQNNISPRTASPLTAWSE